MHTLKILRIPIDYVNHFDGDTNIIIDVIIVSKVIYNIIGSKYKTEMFSDDVTVL